MANCIVKQPNGLLAVFSTIVDDFTAVNLTEAEAVAYLTKPGPLQHTEDEAVAKVRRGVYDEPYTGGPANRYHRGDGLDRWCDSLQTVMAIHGWRTAYDRIRVTCKPR